MQSLLQYLGNLANDPAAQQKFTQDPDAAIAAADLSDQDKAILKTRNAGLIHATVGQQAVAAMVYATPPQPQPAMIYACPQPHMIYASPMIYACPQPHMIYASPMIYGAQQPPAMIYGAQQPPAMIYAAQHPAMIYGAPPQPSAMIYGAQQPPAMIYGAHNPAMIYATQPAPMIYATPPKPGDPSK